MSILFLFRRDIRLQDNIGLIEALKMKKPVLPIFIFTPEQISNKNSFKSNNAIQFMIESLQSLDMELRKYDSRLHLFYGDTIHVLKKIKMLIPIQAIVFNKDYTPYAKKRDKDIMDTFYDVEINAFEDYLLSPMGSFLKDDGSIYRVFTPFLRRVKAHKDKINRPIRITKSQLSYLSKSSALKQIEHGYIQFERNEHLLVHGGRPKALEILRKLKQHKHYNDDRSDLSKETTQLSAYIKFGNISVREAYYKIYDTLGKDNQLLSQFIWRDFYYYIANYVPRVFNKRETSNFNGKPSIKWKKSKKEFNAWANGETGFPIIDAGMRQMNKTGYMHNRARLITSNFLNRLLLQDWHKGEKYFAQQLTDYDPSVNNGNWQWTASTGVDTKPYSQRVYNPWLQSERYDTDATYIKTWIPELKDIPAKHLHKWDTYCDAAEYKDLDYPEPIISYEERRKLSIQKYKDIQ